MAFSKNASTMQKIWLSALLLLAFPIHGRASEFCADMLRGFAAEQDRIADAYERMKTHQQLCDFGRGTVIPAQKKMLRTAEENRTKCDNSTPEIEELRRLLRDSLRDVDEDCRNAETPEINRLQASPKSATFPSVRAKPTAASAPPIKHSAPKHPMLGVKIVTLSKDMAKKLNTTRTQGAFVQAVFGGSIAKEAGVQPRDIIVRIGNYDINEQADLPHAVQQIPDIANAEITYWRNGQKHTVSRAPEWNYCDHGTPDEIIRNCTAILQSRTENLEEAYNHRGIAWADKGEADRAIADYSEAIRLSPDYDAPYNNRGNTYRAKGDLDGALADYTKAIEIDPKTSIPYNGRGVTYYAKGDLDRAIADYTKAIEIDPEYAQPYDNRGNAYGAKGDLDGALADYTKAIEINPEYADAYGARGRLNLWAGYPSKALGDLNRLSQLSPKDAYAALWLDIANKRSNLPSRLQQAMKQIDMRTWPAPLIRLYLGQLTRDAVLALADDPNTETKKDQMCEANFYIGELALNRGDKDEAERLFQVAAADCPKAFVEYAGAVAELKVLGKTTALTSGIADACSPDERANLQKRIIGKWQFFSGGQEMCHGEIYRSNGSFTSFDKDCAMKVLAPDSEKYGRWSVDDHCKLQLVFNKPIENFAGQRGRFVTITPIFRGQNRFNYKETFLGDDTYYQRK